MLETPLKRVPNQHIILEDYCQIIITQAGRTHVCYLDHPDLDDLKRFHFSVNFIHGNYYAYCMVKGRKRYLHRLVGSFGVQGLIVHHKCSGPDKAISTLDCRRSVLQLLYKSEHDSFHAVRRQAERREAAKLAA